MTKLQRNNMSLFKFYCLLYKVKADLYDIDASSINIFSFHSFHFHAILLFQMVHFQSLFPQCLTLPDLIKGRGQSDYHCLSPLLFFTLVPGHTLRSILTNSS